MEETTALKTTFGMVSHLIGPKKWQALLRELEVFPEISFDVTMTKLEKLFRKISERVWASLMHWKLSQGTKAKVERVIGALHKIDVHWLALSVQSHLEKTGYLLLPDDDCLTCEQRRARRRKLVTPAGTPYPVDRTSRANKPLTPASEAVTSVA